MKKSAICLLMLASICANASEVESTYLEFFSNSVYVDLQALRISEERIKSEEVKKIKRLLAHNVLLFSYMVGGYKPDLKDFPLDGKKVLCYTHHEYDRLLSQYNLPGSEVAMSYISENIDQIMSYMKFSRFPDPEDPCFVDQEIGLKNK